LYHGKAALEHQGRAGCEVLERAMIVERVQAGLRREYHAQAIHAPR
jgi:hypothetical protein